MGLNSVEKEILGLERINHLCIHFILYVKHLHKGMHILVNTVCHVFIFLPALPLVHA